MGFLYLLMMRMNVFIITFFEDKGKRGEKILELVILRRCRVLRFDVSIIEDILSPIDIV